MLELVMDNYWLILILLGVAVIAGLGFYAGKLLWQLKAQNERVAKEKAKIEKLKAERNAKISDSVHLIAKAMREKQCEYSEGCLRIWVLLDSLSSSVEVDYAKLYPGIAAMYDVVKDMPTHEARKKYSKKEIFRMDKQRWQAESELEEQIQLDSGKLIKDYAAMPGSENVVFS